MLEALQKLWAAVKPYVTSTPVIVIVSALLAGGGTWFVEGLRKEVAVGDAATVARAKGHYDAELSMNEVAARAAARTVDQLREVLKEGGDDKKIIQRRVRTKKVTETGSIE